MAKKVRLTSPLMALKFGAITVPDTQFNPEGIYYAKCLIDPDKGESFLKSLDELTEKAREEGLKKAKPAKKKSMAVNSPYDEDFDKEGNETGKVLVKFSTKYSVPVFDSKGNKIENLESFDIWGRSKLKINYTPDLYYVAGTNTAGVKLYMNAVQVVELVSGSGGTADMYGFNDEEGYEYKNTPVLPTAEDNDFEIEDEPF